MSATITPAEARKKLSEVKNGSTEWGRDFYKRLRDAEKNPLVKDPVFDEWKEICANAKPDPKPAYVNAHSEAEQIEARATIERMKSDPAFQKSFWDSNEIGHRQAVNQWHSCFQIAWGEQPLPTD